ncbi:DUF3859 domain-containing protein [Flavobacterium xinjiangense]|uniref:DUF3859 domain-containing protein n=1 Tax=Flavobacterium xinjiangense TaxID=178356 RepID=A0A1M7HN06_9FLAO|nr:DUF3859 domain-containing protein [Flavobacterium xinjiangense]SHM29834.1 protein of unknown function [Flavobacterium xinjiangense]
MKIITVTLLGLLIFQTTFSQTTINSKTNGVMEFKELDYGLAKVKKGINEKLSQSPTGGHGWLEDFEIINKTDSIQALQKANFGVIYIVKAKDTVDIDVVIEWIYPAKIINEKGETFKSIKYTTKRPTNIPSASSYSLDETYELVKGDWKMNIYIDDKRVCSKKFILY